MGNAILGHFAEDVIVNEVDARDRGGWAGGRLAGDFGGELGGLGTAVGGGRGRVVLRERRLAEGKSGGEQNGEFAHFVVPSGFYYIFRRRVGEPGTSRGSFLVRDILWAPIRADAE